MSKEIVQETDIGRVSINTVTGETILEEPFEWPKAKLQIDDYQKSDEQLYSELAYHAYS